ncbi:MAG: hypothetical protein KF906_11825 [Actinobacteria bacterium]|nr:hypothetical protein [Actinomycetota bacterium]
MSDTAGATEASGAAGVIAVPRRLGRFTSEQVAAWTFVAYLVVAAPLILFHFGAYHWFFRDDLMFLTERTGRWPPFLEPHGGAHMSVVPRFVYLVLWQLFGMRSYLPYQMCVVALHLTAAFLLRMVMRRAGAGPWIATVVAAVFVLFGPGAQNIVWAFQVGFTGSLVYGLGQLLLADHDGPIGRRDLAALGLGLLAAASSGVGIAMAVAVGVAVLLRRGWRAAALQTVPLAVLVGVWAVVYDAGSTPGSTRPTIGQVLAWVRESYIGVFEAIGYFDVLAVLIAGITVLGIVLAVRRAPSPRDALRTAGLPVGLVAGGLTFTVMTALGRASHGTDLAQSSRYMHIIGASLLPLIAVSADQIARRWPRTLPVLLVVFLVPIPCNTRAFTPTFFGEPYMRERERILTIAPRVPFADEIPGWVQPIPDPYMGDVTMAFLRGAARNGDLPEPPNAIGPKTIEEFKVRLGVALVTDGSVPPLPTDCRRLSGPTSLSVTEGDLLRIDGDVDVSTRTGDEAAGPAVRFSTNPFNRNVFEVQLPDLDLLLVPRGNASICTEG